jgi:hypothetical protein
MARGVGTIEASNGERRGASARTLYTMSRVQTIRERLIFSFHNPYDRLRSLAILEAAVLECKKRDVNTSEVKNALDRRLW